MTALILAEPGSLAWVLQLLVWLALGVALGAAHFLSLRWSVRWFLAGRTGPSLALQAGRLVLLGGVLAAVAIWCGALPLLAATGGLLVARTAVLRLGAAP
ncbi:MAG: hypothetical protein H6844_12670 [Alphaproteobacteria bacterium]|nr:hypothetical protein [Alphaproteobacteria bacterium]